MLKKFFLIVGILVLIIVGLNFYVYQQSAPFVLSVNADVVFPVGIVPGAGLNRDKTPSLALRDRLDAAFKFSEDGNISKILVSGDNRFIYYDEPSAMANYLEEKGVPEADVVRDFAGQRTYDTCYRAKHIFGLDRVLIFTQTYHLWRAVYLCRALGLDAFGITIDESNYVPSRYRYWQFREVFARSSAVWDVNIGKPIPILGDPEPIFH